jgi:hypothetical protein
MITTVIAYVLGSNDEGSKLESLTKFIEETLIGRHQRSLTNRGKLMVCCYLQS